MRKQHSTLLEIVLDEGRNREVRRLLARVGHKVLRLQRISQGALKLGTLAPGEYRPMTLEEVEGLKEAAREAIGKPRPKRPRRPKPAELEHDQDDDVVDVPTDDVAEALIDDTVPLSTDDDVEQFFLHVGKVIGDEGDEGDDDSSAKRKKKTPRPVTGRTSLKPLIDLRKNKAKPVAEDDDEEADDDDFTSGFPVADIADDDESGDEDFDDDSTGADDADDEEAEVAVPDKPAGPRRKMLPPKAQERGRSPAFHSQRAETPRIDAERLDFRRRRPRSARAW
ncbi:MAG: hypothetical protein QM811_31275 [Pirellulales bacterium]